MYVHTYVIFGALYILDIQYSRCMLGMNTYTVGK